MRNSPFGSGAWPRSPGEVLQTQLTGELIKTFAFRGATHLLTPEEGGAFLALRASGRMWERPSWQSIYGLTPADWPPLRARVRQSLANGPRTWPELASAVTSRAEYRHLAQAFADRSATLWKPFAWQGDLSFGPTQDGQATFQGLHDNPRWSGLPDVDAAGRYAVENYLQAYGPATPARLQYWLGDGLGAARKRIRTWIAELDDRIAHLDIDGTPAIVLRKDVDGIANATPVATSVRLLPGHDQWVLGPGTADVTVVPPAHRALVTWGANLIIVGGVVRGTWSITDNRLAATWLDRPAPQQRDLLAEEVHRLSAIVGRPLTLAVTTD